MKLKRNPDQIAEGAIRLAEHYKDSLSPNKVFLKKNLPENQDEAICFLLELFDEAEKIILEEHKKTFVTDAYENNVREFAAALMKFLIPYHSRLKNKKPYKDLCRKRHIGYGYYKTVNSRNFQGQVISDDSYRELLYLGLAEFYNNFYGKFSDNEEAIELLCKHYPKNMNMEQHVEEISSALYIHISNAGTPGDLGYAYQGIKMIEKYISNLPENIVYAVLDKYSLYDLVNSKLRRHQLFAIIDHADFHMADKKVLKFWYLDSVIAGEMIGQLVLENLREEGTEISSHNNYYDYRLSDEEYIVLNEPFTYWKNDLPERERVLLLEDKLAIIIYLQNYKMKVHNQITGQYESFPYRYEDWLVESFSRGKNEEKLRGLVSGTGRKGKMPYGSMTFSLAYLDHYRGLQDQVIDFDHRFVFGSSDKLLKKKDTVTNKIPHIYGKSVYSLSCIVGKNATGKTSIIDFLREAFFKILKFIQEGRLTCENGYIREEEYEDYNILDKSAMFLVAFSLSENTYFVTNIQGVQADGAKPFYKGAYNRARQLSKVAYFSSQLRSDQGELLWDEQNQVVYDEEKRRKQDISKVNSDFRQADYSEKASFIRKRKTLRLSENMKETEEPIQYTAGNINKDICFQLTFLKKSRPGKIQEYLDEKEQKEFRIISRLYGERYESFFLKELEGQADKGHNQEKMARSREEIWRKLEEFVKLPDAAIEHFSAGQYAKFSFLAKLQWFLDGDKEEIQRYNELTGDFMFSEEEVLLDGETALIFIDEGEIYYHPEWQRGYIKLLLEMVNARRKKVQIIVTTNSPFIISDILGEDITYLSEDKINEKNKKRDRECTLGQNIHKLLRDNFFMQYTIGEYARELIENIMLCLNEEKEHDESNRAEKILKLYFDEIRNYYDAFHLLIDQIGEPVYKNTLKKMLDLSPFAEENKDIEKQIRELEEKIQKLKERR